MIIIIIMIKHQSYLSSEQQLWRCVVGTLELEAIRDKLGSQQLCGPGRCWFNAQKTKKWTDLIYAYLCLSWSYLCLSMLIYMLIYILKKLDWESFFENRSASKFPWSDWWFSAPRKIRFCRSARATDFQLFHRDRHRASNRRWQLQASARRWMTSAKSMQSHCKVNFNAFAATIECSQMHFPKNYFFILKKEL